MTSEIQGDLSFILSQKIGALCREAAEYVSNSNNLVSHKSSFLVGPSLWVESSLAQLFLSSLLTFDLLNCGSKSVVRFCSTLPCHGPAALQCKWLSLDVLVGGDDAIQVWCWLQRQKNQLIFQDVNIFKVTWIIRSMICWPAWPKPKLNTKLTFNFQLPSPPPFTTLYHPS